MLKNLSTPLLDSNIGALKISLGGHIETYCSVHFSLNRIKAFCKSFFCVFTKGILLNQILTTFVYLNYLFVILVLVETYYFHKFAL